MYPLTGLTNPPAYMEWWNNSLLTVDYSWDRFWYSQCLVGGENGDKWRGPTPCETWNFHGNQDSNCDLLGYDPCNL